MSDSVCPSQARKRSSTYLNPSLPKLLGQLVSLLQQPIPHRDHGRHLLLAPPPQFNPFELHQREYSIQPDAHPAPVTARPPCPFHTAAEVRGCRTARSGHLLGTPLLLRQRFWLLVFFVGAVGAVDVGVDSASDDEVSAGPMLSEIGWGRGGHCSFIHDLSVVFQPTSKRQVQKKATAS